MHPVEIILLIATSVFVLAALMFWFVEWMTKPKKPPEEWIAVMEGMYIEAKRRQRAQLRHQRKKPCG